MRRTNIPAQGILAEPNNKTCYVDCALCKIHWRFTNLGVDHIKLSCLHSTHANSETRLLPYRSAEGRLTVKVVQQGFEFVRAEG